MELGPEDVPLLEKCLHWYVQASMPDDVSLLEVSSFQRKLCTGVGT